MKVQNHRKPRVNIVTLGCSKNQVDSEEIYTQLRGSGVRAQHESDQDLPVVVINTCGFIESAREESIDTILQYAEAKEEGRVKKIYVTGCLSHRYKKELETEIPQIDAWFGTNELPRLLKSLQANYKKELIGERILSKPSHYSYLKIAEGCNRTCSFCAIPIMRGNHVSRPMPDLVKEATFLAQRGTRELLLIAQDSTYYGIDLYKKKALAELMCRLSDIEGIDWIRLHYAFPIGFPMDILTVMRERKNICRYLDIPLQHVSTSILKRMRRWSTRQRIEDLIETIRHAVPDMAFRTTLMSGYPGETEDDHEELIQFVQDMRFDRLGMFTYSHEENTAAFHLADDVPEQVKKKRMEEIMTQQRQISLEINQQKIGLKMPVIIDRVEKNISYGRTEFDSPDVDNTVIITGDNRKIKPGDFITAHITGAGEYDLEAIIIQDEKESVGSSI